MGQSHRVGIDGARVDRAGPWISELFGTWRRGRGSDIGFDRFGHVGNHIENVGRLARITFRPDVFVCPASDELDRHLDNAAHAQHTALDQGVHTQFVSDVLQRQLAVTVAFCRLPRRHPQPTYLRKLGNQDVLQTLGVISLLRVTGQVAQGKHGQ